MDNRLREEAFVWIKEMASVIVEASRRDDPDSAKRMERETSRYLKAMRQLSEGKPVADDRIKTEAPVRPTSDVVTALR